MSFFSFNSYDFLDIVVQATASVYAVNLWKCIVSLGKRLVKTQVTQKKRKGKLYGELYANFPFLTDEETISFIKDRKVMFIMRGLPGSGKSHLITLLQATYPDAVVCSADMYFEENNLPFDKELLGQAHAHCQNLAEDSCQDELIVFIDNTNVKCWEMSAYFKMAKDHDYIMVVVVPQTPWAFNVAELATKNLHGVSEDKIRQRNKDFSPCYPLYVGWFLDTNQALEVANLARYYLELVKNAFEVFKGVEDQKHTWNTTRFHVTAGYIGHHRCMKEGGEKYVKKVTPYMGQHYRLQVSGFSFTPYTIGAIVELTQEQQDLFLCDSESTPANAHITLALADGIKPARTKVDLRYIITCELEGQVNRTCVLGEGVAFEVETSHIKVTLNTPVTIDTLFSGCY